MIRQAHTYLAGAVSSTALVAAAVVAFVLLVSFQALRDWPLTGIGIGGDDSAASGPSHPAGGSAASQAEIGGAGVTAAGAVKGPPRSGGAHSKAKQDDQLAAGTSPTATTGSPKGETPPSRPTGQGGGGPSTGSSPTGSASANPASGGGAATGTGSQGSGGSQSTSGAVAGTVNETVSGVDEATGGVVGSTGVTEVTERVVNGVAGPESPVGKTVDSVGETVNCVLGCK